MRTCLVLIAIGLEPANIQELIRPLHGLFGRYSIIYSTVMAFLTNTF